MAEQEEQEERKTYRVKAGKQYGALREGETVELTEAEAAPFLGELEEVPPTKKPPAKTPAA